MKTHMLIHRFLGLLAAVACLAGTASAQSAARFGGPGGQDGGRGGGGRGGPPNLPPEQMAAINSSKLSEAAIAQLMASAFGGRGRGGPGGGAPSTAEGIPIIASKQITAITAMDQALRFRTTAATAARTALIAAAYTDPGNTADLAPNSHLPTRVPTNSSNSRPVSTGLVPSKLPC